MAITIYPDYRSQQGSDLGAGNNADIKRTLRLVAKASTKLDGPGNALAAADAAGYTLGSSYSVGNDTDSSLKLKRRTVARVQGRAQLLWEVMCYYENARTEMQEGTQQDGEISYDPTTWRDEFEIVTVRTSMPANDAIYKGNTSAQQNFLYRTVGDRGPVITTAGELIDKQKDNSRFQIRVATYQTTYNMDLYRTFKDAVNNQPWLLGYQYYNFTYQFPAFSCKIALLQGRPVRINKIDVWRIEAVIDYMADAENAINNTPYYWQHIQQNAGYFRRAEAGDPVGGELGGTYANNAPNGSLPMAAIHERQSGNLVQVPVDLDLDGQPIIDRSVNPPIHLLYQIYDERDFALLPFGTWAGGP